MMIAFEGGLGVYKAFEKKKDCMCNRGSIFGAPITIWDDVGRSPGSIAIPAPGATGLRCGVAPPPNTSPPSDQRGLLFESGECLDGFPLH